MTTLLTTDTAHQAWDESWRSDAGRADWLTAEDDVLAQATRLRLAGAQTVLDLGCGVGRHALALASLGFSVTALDASQAGLTVVKQNASARSLSLKTKLGKMTDLPFDDNSFDFVLSWNVIYHGDHNVVSTTVDEIRRVLNPGGTFQGTMLSKRRADYGVGNEISPNTFVQPEGDGDKIHPHFFCDASECVTLFAGFEILELKDVDPEAEGNWHWHLVAEKV